MQVSPEELREHLRTMLAKWQLPERIEFVAAIPRTATGKFKKIELRQQFAGSTRAADSRQPAKVWSRLQ